MDSGETQVAIVSGEETISVVANLDDATFDLDVGGDTANDVDFTNDVDINTVKNSNVSDGNFGHLEIDDVSITADDGWESGNSLSIIITGTGQRTLNYDGANENHSDVTRAPLLCIHLMLLYKPTNLSATLVMPSLINMDCSF